MQYGPLLQEENISYKYLKISLKIQVEVFWVVHLQCEVIDICMETRVSEPELSLL
jgi:hypothetical protein